FRCLGSNLAVDLDRLLERPVGFGALGRSDGLAPDPPELLDAADAPPCALPRGADRLSADEHVDWVGVHLREVADPCPVMSVGLHREGQLVWLSIGWLLLVALPLGVDDAFNSVLAAVPPALIGGVATVQLPRIADQPVAAGRDHGAIRPPHGCVGG